MKFLERFSEEEIIRYFRWACIGEGITCILLYLVAMPLKYSFDNYLFMIPAGIIHGVFFSFYLVLTPLVKKPLFWDDEDFIFVLMAAFFPFATFWIERSLLDAEKNKKNND